jgi:DNA-binding MarR family transcriptional regulator
MSKKQEFIKYVNELIDATSEFPVPMNEDAKLYWEAFCGGDGETEKPALTDNGKLILKYLQDHPEVHLAKARDIAEGLFISPRGVSGSMRKLANDGFVEKLGDSPSVYSITEKGKNFIIED